MKTKYYIDRNNNPYGFDIDGSQDHLITNDMKPISLEEIQAINKAKEDEYKQTTEYKKQEALNYLNSTDFYYPRFLETGETVPEDVVIKRIEARDYIRANNVVV